MDKKYRVENVVSQDAEGRSVWATAMRRRAEGQARQMEGYGEAESVEAEEAIALFNSIEATGGVARIVEV